ncbi:MAG: hypothetical protein HYV26_11710 [Candidatus Hydrogenedentes bacterium]|nr:hypothetical protein [Candidatus Hydrogenedentota bacterium]
MHDRNSERHSASAFMRWILTPVLLLFLASMPLYNWDKPAARGPLLVIVLLTLAFMLGLWLPPRIARYAYRIAAGCVFVIVAACFLFEAFRWIAPTRLNESKGKGSPRDALTPLIIFGGPALAYALLGRATWRQADEEDPAACYDDPEAPTEDEDHII